MRANVAVSVQASPRVCPSAHAGGPRLHHTAMGSAATVASPGLQPKACAKAGVFDSGASTRQRPGEWLSLCSWSVSASVRYLPRQLVALAMKKRCAGVDPSTSGAGVPVACWRANLAAAWMTGSGRHGEVGRS